MSDWTFVGCPKCKLNRFRVLTQIIREVIKPGQNQKLQTVKIECDNCKTVLINLAQVVS